MMEAAAEADASGPEQADILLTQRAINELIKTERLRFLSRPAAVAPLPPSGEPASLEVQAGGLAAELQAELWRAARAGAAGEVTLAVRRGAAVDVGDASFHGWTALHRAADKGADAAVRALLHFKADPNLAEAARGLTPLHLAVHQGRLEVARQLLAAGADPHRPDAAGVRPTDLARAGAGRSSRHRDIQVRGRAAMSHAHGFVADGTRRAY
jgi:ankyrin repeat protein